MYKWHKGGVGDGNGGLVGGGRTYNFHATTSLYFHTKYINKLFGSLCELFKLAEQVKSFQLKDRWRAIPFLAYTFVPV